MDNYLNPILGGLIIGLSAVLLMYFLGRIAGISGILWKAVEPAKLSEYLSEERRWRWMFVLGLPLGAWLAMVVFRIVPDAPVSSNPILIILAGLLVGFGSRLGNGCTSGHGICGIGRFSKRSIVATLVFMSSGILTVFIVGKLGGMS